MTDYIQHKPTAEERKQKQAQKAAEREQKRLNAIENIPDSVHGIPVVDVSYTAVSKKQVKEMRHSFTKKRAEFLKTLAAENADDLKKAGLSDRAVNEMAKGRSPNGYNVHHKLPLAGGGKNEFSNFILIKIDPYHDDIHRISNVQIAKLNPGETATIKMPIPAGNIFIPPKQDEKEKQKPLSPVLMQKIQNCR